MKTEAATIATTNATRIQNFGERKPILSAPDAAFARYELHISVSAADAVPMEGLQDPSGERQNRERSAEPTGQTGERARGEFRNCDEGPRNADQNSENELIAFRLVNSSRPVSAAPSPTPAQ